MPKYISKKEHKLGTLKGGKQLCDCISKAMKNEYGIMFWLRKNGKGEGYDFYCDAGETTIIKQLTERQKVYVQKHRPKS